MDNEKKQIEFTKEEAGVLLNLINRAVQNVGISDGGAIAQNAIYFSQKLNKAFEVTPKELRDKALKKVK